MELTTKNMRKLSGLLALALGISHFSDADTPKCSRLLTTQEYSIAIESSKSKYASVGNSRFQQLKDDYLRKFPEERVPAVDLYNRDLSPFVSQRVEIALSRPIDPAKLSKLEARWANIDRARKQLDWLDFAETANHEGARPNLVSAYMQIQEARLGLSTSVQEDQTGRVRENWYSADNEVLKGAAKFNVHSFFGQTIVDLLTRLNRILLDGEQANYPGGVILPRRTVMFEKDGPAKTATGRQTYISGFERGHAISRLISQWCNDNCHHLHPIIVASSLYQRIVSIHPFWNGNGRSARLVADYLLIAYGYPPPLLDPTAGKRVAVFAFNDFDQNPSLDTILELFTDGIEDSMELMSQGLIGPPGLEDSSNSGTEDAIR